MKTELKVFARAAIARGMIRKEQCMAIDVRFC